MKECIVYREEKWVRQTGERTDWTRARKETATSDTLKADTLYNYIIRRLGLLLVADSQSGRLISKP